MQQSGATQIAVVAETGDIANALNQRLGPIMPVADYRVADLPESGPPPMAIIDVDLRDRETVDRLKVWLKSGLTDQQVAFCVNRRSGLEPIQAYALGATCVLPRPLDVAFIANKIMSCTGALCSSPSGNADAFMDCISTGVDALQGAFAAAISGEAPDMGTLGEASSTVVDTISEIGLKRWLEIVHKHHSRTFQHSLIVTGVAVSFAQHLGVSVLDQRRMATAGLLHDVGKARVPIEILEKPGALTPQEMNVIRIHPEAGHEVLCGAPDIQPEMLDIVLHHHEMLDGSGYPHGLTAPDISDLVRMVTVADVYGALIERRSYKPPMSGEDAYTVLEGMGPKLDRGLVHAFRPLAGEVV